MIFMLILLAALSLTLMAALVLLGFCLGGTNRPDQVADLRLQAIEAERLMHDLTRSAFVAMAEVAERRSQGRQG